MNIRSLIDELQCSSEERKTRWVVGLTLASSTLVAALWMGYVAVEVPAIPQPKARLAALGARPPMASLASGGPIAIAEHNGKPAEGEARQRRPGVTETLAVGAREVTDTVGGRISRGVAMVKALFAKSNTLEVRAAKQNFILEGMEAVPETTFP